MHDEKIGAAICISKRCSHRHLPAEFGICCLELDHFNYLSVRHKLHEVAVVRVGMRGRLAGHGRRIVRERDTERATFAASNSCTLQVIPVGTLHVATE